MTGTAPTGPDMGATFYHGTRADLDLGALPQWTMNVALANIGIRHPEHRDRTLAIGERLGVYRDYPTSPGCTSPFAPDWIGEMVRRQK